MRSQVVVLLLLSVAWKACCLHEAVVNSVLLKVSSDLTKETTSIPEYVYSFDQNLGPLTVTVKLHLTTGTIIVTGIKLNGPVQYTLPEAEGPANFKYDSLLEVFVAYRYTVYGAGSVISHGMATGSWGGPLQISMDVEPTGCSVKLRNVSRNTTSFDVEVTPQDNIFYPLTVHFPPGDLLEKHIEKYLEKLLTKGFNDKKLCDCVTCYGP